MAKKDKIELDLSETPVSEIEGDDEDTFLGQVRKNLIHAEDRWSENYRRAREEVRFANLGEQWDAEAVRERLSENRPFLTFNDLPQFAAQIIGDIRLNRPGIHVSPADTAGAEESVLAEGKKKKMAMAEVYEGLIRNIEYTSHAEAHYDNAAQHAVEAGFGWLRVLPTYESPRSFELDIRIKGIPNRWAVLIDPDAEEPDFADADYCFIGDRMTRAAFNKSYPNAAQGDLVPDRAWWGDRDYVCVAEYFERYPCERELIKLQSGEVTYADMVKDILDELEERGEIVQRRTVDTYKIRWWKLTANSVLRGPVDMPCTTIPVVPVLGLETNIDGKKDFRGIYRHAMDPKRADNFWMTAATERVAMAPNAPWIGTETMFEGREAEWATANRGSKAYLTYNSDPLAPNAKPTREAPPPMPAAELTMAAQMTDKVKSTIGMYNAGLGAPSNETSGRAITARQRESDVGTFVFPDNLSRAIRRIGLLMIELIPAVYDTNRLVRLRNEDSTGEWVEINKAVKDEETGKDVVVHDLARGSYDVVVRTGPSYTTQREEAAEALMEFMRVTPQIGALIIDKVADAMDWPGAKAIRKRLLHTIPPHMLTEEEQEERGEVPQPEPTPEEQASMMQAEADMKGAEADMAKAQAEMAKAEAMMADIETAGSAPAVVEIIRSALAEVVAEITAHYQNTPKPMDQKK